ncbi:MAG: NAD(P)H-binding protein [Candidatus Binatia bacterium]|nr:NAD(P)H-binding protein [Candidatus Binatia bacterium]
MKATIFGATGSLGSECVQQSLEAGHEVTVLARSPSKLPQDVTTRVRVVQGDALREEDVWRALEGGCEAVLFAIGVDKNSPEDLCTNVTEHVLNGMRHYDVGRFIWCGGGSTIVADDQVTFGARFVEGFSRLFLGLRHRDKAHQLALLDENTDVQWLGVRPLQMRSGPRREVYRLGFDAFSGFSNISFADCAHAMVGMLGDDTWSHKAPIAQYGKPVLDASCMPGTNVLSFAPPLGFPLFSHEPEIRDRGRTQPCGAPVSAFE